MTSILVLVAAVFGSLFKGKRALVLENLALRQQLATYKRTSKRPRLRMFDRAFWVGLTKLWGEWRAALIIVKPETVIRWHREGFKLYWRHKSRTRKIGRPTIPRKHINFIRRMSADNPTWGEDKIFEELSVKFGIEHSTSTIRKYMVKRRRSHDRQAWKTFTRNHGHEIFACDFLTQHTAFFAVIYIFVVMELGTRRIVHINVTQHPTLCWVKRQIRHIAAFDRSPRFLVHDNDGIFGQFGQPKEGSDGKRHRCHLDLWLAQVFAIKGIPTPFHTPNANAHVERFNRTLREDALNHFIFLGQDHIRRVTHEFVAFYNGARPSQGRKRSFRVHAIPEPYADLQKPPLKNGKLVAVLGRIQHDYRLAA
jgi:hypothetical protein